MTPLVVTPHPILLDNQRREQWALQPGESLYAFLQRHVPDLDGKPWRVTIGGREIPRHMWHLARPKNGHVIEVRGGLGDNALYYIAMAVLIYFTAGAGATWAGGLSTALGVSTSVIYSAAFIAGSMLINAVLAPKPPSASGAASKDSVYNIGAARNAMRPYEPFALVFGEVRSTPDYLAQPYTYYEGNQQYVAMLFQPGLNCESIGPLYNGDALLSSFDGVSTWYAGFPGMPEQDIPIYSNVDTIDGAELPTTKAWVQRTTSANTVAVQINLEYMLGGTGTSGKEYQVSETVEVQYRPVGASAWQPLLTRTFTSKDQTTVRRTTLSADLPRGQYDLQARIRGDGNYEGKNQQTNKFQWTTLGSVQADDADYTGIPRIGVRIKATGQLNGYPDEIRGVVRAEPLPIWNGTTWATATDRASGLSNPGAQLLKYARGHAIVKAGKTIRYAGLGLTDDMIDIEALKGFMLHCAANGYTYDYIVKDAKSHDEVCNTIALAGMGEISWAGGKFSVVWAGADQPVSGVVNMATIKKSSFRLDYSLVSAADGIEYTYFDRDTWSSQTIYVNAPGVEVALNPAKVSGEGVTSAVHAARMARYHLAQSLYQYKSISYDTDLEHMTYRRMSVLPLQHDMTQWGYGGRLTASSTASGVTRLSLDEAVPPPAEGNAYIGVRVPGERVYRVLQVRSFGAQSRDIELAEPWPGDAALPGVEKEAHDYIWIYDFKQTPGYRVRVTSIEPQSDLKGASIRVVPESDEFWDYVIDGTYRKPDNQSLLQTKPTASHLVVTESQVVQGDTVFTELVATFDVSGPVGVTRAYCDTDGNAELELVAETTGRTARWRIPGAGTYPITVRPYNLDGEAGTAVSLIYTTQGADAPPVLVDTFTVEELSGGVRRYSWGYSDDTIQSADFAGVEIRYTAGSVTAPAWETMTPLGDTGYHAAAFEAVLPASGTWTFACRSRNTSGTLSPDARIVTQTLGANLGQQLGELGDASAAAQAAITQEIIDRFNADAAAAEAAAADASAKANAALAAAIAHADVIGAQVADIIGADTWVSDKAYPKGDLVKFEGNLYRALDDVPAGTAVSDTAHWQLLGQYDSLGEATAAALAIANQNVTDLAAEVARLDAIVARLPAGAGKLASEALVATEQQARVDGDNALAGRTSTIEGRMPTGTDKLANEARVVTAENASVTRDNALGTRVDGVQAKLPADGGRSASEANVSSFAQASVDRDNALSTRVDTAQTKANDAQTTATNALSASNNNASAINYVSIRAGAARPNMLSGGSFETGMWTLGETANWVVGSGTWGSYGYHSNPGSINGGGHSIHRIFDSGENTLHTISWDSVLFASSGSVRVDIEWLDVNGNLINTNGGNTSQSVQASHDFSDDTSRREQLSWTTTSPAGTRYGRFRCIWEGVTGCTALGFRRIKVEKGDLPSTPYSTETTVAQQASVTQSLSTSLNTLTGQFNAKYTLALSVNGYVSGVTSVNNGTTSTFDILADTVRFLAPSGGARTEFSNGNWRVYDGNGVLRTAMGINI
ncbi:host specificity factor TipJ family phage tail protein [Pseudoxanthomonas winnipegensis]|uniref:host specificity factor TipJ family phage tail protein n=1 Tax=Pseudoxanthomonas winnipegensis TaxID=2480810 RepID=UPI00102E0730|nr:host specificity factor TipJ family phage tail protein [Pseudoxanthomonas winnipegensis]RZZ81934.1 hypothetical protein EA662_17335 [Pseudoxanthomonas winnipegensis]TBV72307.1 hypothetical protein EYC46_16995 [Pseudoxanthomonas winnipegensis]